jgi:hypothetical protein
MHAGFLRQCPYGRWHAECSETEKGGVTVVVLKLDRVDGAFDGSPDMPLCVDVPSAS